LQWPIVRDVRTALDWPIVRDVRNSNLLIVISVRFWFSFWKNSDSVWNEFGSVWFEKLGSDIVVIIVIYCLYNTSVVNLQQILQHYCAVLKEACTAYQTLIL